MEHIKLTDSKTGDVVFQADTLDYRVRNIWIYFEQRKVPRSSLLRWVGEVIIKYAQEQAAKDAFNSLQTLLLTNRQFALPVQEGIFVIDALHYKPETREVRISLEEVLC